MILSLFIILLITLSGTVLTYVYDKKDSLLPRLAAGNIIGSAIFGLVGFLFACGFGLSSAIVWLSVIATMLSLCLLKNSGFRESFFSDLKSAKGRIEGANLGKFLSFSYFAGFTILFYFFFNRVMFETPEGIFIGGSNNLGDLPFHLGAIFSFTEGSNFPPENPSFAFAKFTYPFIVDFIVACFVKLGASVENAFLAQNITLSLSLIILFEKFVVNLTNNKLAGKIACLIFLFSGGLGFIIFFRDYWQDGRSFFEFIWNLPKDYTILPKGIRWGNSLTTLFLTQRGLLLGLPLTLIALIKLWEIFNSEKTEINESEETIDYPSDFNALIPIITVGLLVGMLPLVHVHSLAAIFIVSAFLFFFRFDKWREWIAFGVSVAIIAVPELIWTLTGSASNVGKFIGWHFGWDSGDSNIFVFWSKNLGLFAPLLVLGIVFFWNRKNDENNQLSVPNYRLLLFYVPFAFIFFLSNLVKLAPWEWDNIKLLIYWFVGSLPFVAWLLAEMWKKKVGFKITAVLCLFILTFSGLLDVWRTISKQINYPVFSRDSVKIAEQIKEKTLPNALFLNAPTYNSAVVLSGRRSLMRYIGHLGSYGIDYEPRYDEVKRIYEGSALAESFLQKNQIDYVIISPEEPGWVKVNEEYFMKYPLIAESGQYRVYKIK